MKQAKEKRFQSKSTTTTIIIASMSTLVQIANANGVAADGRLLNVRTRHLHLTKLHKCLQANQETLVQVALASFPKYTRKIAELSVVSMLEDIEYRIVGSLVFTS